MLLYATLAYLYLLSIETQAVSLWLSNTEYNEPTCENQIENEFDYYLISPDTFDDTFLVAQCKDVATQAPFYSRWINVTLTLHNDNSEPMPNECHAQLIIRGDEPREWGVSSLRRLSKSRFAISWYSHHEDGTTSDVYVLDLDNCDGWTEPVDSLEESPGRPFVLPLSHTSYDVFRDQCGARYRNGACRVQHDFTKPDERHAKDNMRVTYDWTTFRADRMSDERVVVVGWSFADGAYLAHAMNRTRRMAEVFRASNSRGDKFALASSGLSFCWILNPGKDTRVQCQLVDDAREGAILEATVRFDEPIAMIDVRATGESEIMMITKRRECSDERDCWALRATRLGVREDGGKLVEHKDFALPCTGNEQERLVVYEARNDGVRFGCKRGMGFHFGFRRIF